MFTNHDIRSIAARFLFFNEDLDKPISILSGGEKVRLVLLLLLLENPDLLVLDEPTNHLDIETKDIIEDVFDQFSGPIIFVSHDRYFINKIGTKLLYLSNHGTMQEYKGNYYDFKENILVVKDKKQKKQKSKVKTVDETKRIKKLENDIHTLEEKISYKEIEIFKEENYLDKKKMQVLNNEIDEMKQHLEALFEQYILLQEEQEVIQNGKDD